MIEQYSEHGGGWRLTLPDGSKRHYRTESAAKSAEKRILAGLPAKLAREQRAAEFAQRCREVVDAAEKREAARRAWRKQQLALGVHPADLSAYIARHGYPA